MDIIQTKQGSPRMISPPSSVSSFEDPHLDIDAPAPPVLEIVPKYSIEDQVSTWNAVLRGDFSDETAILKLPQRRRTLQRRQALELAKAVYPHLSDVQGAVLYEMVLKDARAAVRQTQKDRIAAERIPKTNAGGRLMVMQGPWAGQELDPLDLKGPTAIPMPVTIGGVEDFRPIFEFLKSDLSYADARKGLDLTSYQLPTDESIKGKFGHELLWSTPLLEFKRGIVYEDDRLDLCKKVVGPTHIGALMKSLESNHKIKQFLLGNNAISTTGAKAIADFIEKYPNRMETWYIAGCYLTRHGLSFLVPQMIKSNSITNLWFKRNPFGPNSGSLLAELVLRTPHLRTLDLETTELGDAGTVNFIDAITGHPSALKNLYLNANGIGKLACASLAGYLADEHCILESLFLGTNPIGDAGMALLAPGILKNKTLKRLTFQSTGLTSHGVNLLAIALVNSTAPLHTLDLSASMTTQAHSQRFNHLDDGCVDALKSLIMSPHMRSLELGRAAFTAAGLEDIKSTAANSELVFLDVHRVELAEKDLDAPDPNAPIYQKAAGRSCSLELHNRLAANQKKYFPAFKGGPDAFRNSEELRFLKNTPDVRKIDSTYRTADKRAGLPMDTPWAEGDPTWKLIVEDAEMWEEASKM